MQQPRFNQQHYDIVNRGVEAIKDWQSKHKSDRLFLEGADLSGDRNLGGADFRNAVLVGANFDRAHLEKAAFFGAELTGAEFTDAKLKGAQFDDALCQGCSFVDANISGVDFHSADLCGAIFMRSTIDGATNFRLAIFDGRSFMDLSKLERRGKSSFLFGTTIDVEVPDFSASSIGNARAEAADISLINHSIRVRFWRKWASEPTSRFDSFFRATVLFLWDLIDYGASTKRLVELFWLISFFYATIYFLSSGFGVHLIHNLSQSEDVNSTTPFPSAVRCLYFSIVTTTTLGFGDMYASPEHSAAELLVASHVIFGYLLLGALITRLGNLFQEVMHE